MYSYGHFKPGGKTNTSRIINYVALYNTLFPNYYPKSYDLKLCSDTFKLKKFFVKFF